MTGHNYIMILGEEVSYSNDRIDIHSLRFYEKNPRVLSKLTRAGKLDVEKEEKQSVIAAELQKEPSVKNLLKSIQKAGGITEPIIVQQSTLEVLEGNSRLAALRMLAKKFEDEINNNFFNAPCQLVELNENQIDALLDRLHVEGKTEWSAFDKAYISYQRVIIDRVEPEEYARRITASLNEINKRIEVIKLMIDQDMDKKPDLFSYYDQIIRSQKLRTAINSNNNLKPFLLQQIKNEKPAFTAAEMRDNIPTIAKKPKVLKRLIDEKINFDEAKEQSTPSTPKKQLTKAWGALQEVSRKDINPLDSNEQNILTIEIKKCKKEIKRIEGILESNFNEGSS